MEQTIRKELTFSEGNTFLNPSPTTSPELNISGNYSEYMANLFGEINIKPVGFSTPGPGVTVESPLSGGSYSSEQSTRELTHSLQLDLSADSMLALKETPQTPRRITPQIPRGIPPLTSRGITQPQTPRGVTYDSETLNHTLQLDLSADTMRALNETYHVQTPRQVSSEHTSQHLPSQVLKREINIPNISDSSRSICQNMQSDTAGTYTPVSRRIESTRTQTQLPSSYNTSLQFSNNQATVMGVDHQPIMQPQLVRHTYQDSAGTLLQPANMLYTNIQHMTGQSGNTSSQYNNLLSIDQNNRNQLLSADNSNKSQTIPSTQEHQPDIWAQTYSIPISDCSSLKQTATTPVLHGLAGQITSTALPENTNEYATFNWQQEQLKQQLAQQLIRGQEEELLRRQHQITLMLHQQEQQWQQLQQQKQAMFTQPVLTDSTVLQQQLYLANSYKNEMSLKAPQVMTTQPEAISISGNVYQTDTTETTHNLMQQTPAMLPLPVTSTAQYGQTPVSLQQNIAMQSLPETSHTQHVQVPTSVSVQQNTLEQPLPSTLTAPYGQISINSSLQQNSAVHSLHLPYSTQQGQVPTSSSLQQNPPVQSLSLTSNAQYEPTPINQSITQHNTAEQSLPITTSVHTGQTHTSNSLQRNLPVQANANTQEAQRQYTTVSVDQNTISRDGQQVPTCMQNTTLTSSQLPTKSNVGCRSDNDRKASSTVEGQQNINPNYALTTEQQSKPVQTSTLKKEIQPDNFDGGGKTEWSDYIIHFEQCAAWNQWTETQKTQMLAIHLRGEAQKLLSSLTVAQLSDYSKLKSILSNRYDPKEKEVTYRCQFRYYRREKGTSASDYGYNLSKLAQKAYPNLTLDQLEVHVIDQFINGLGHHELQKHVQFRHPRTLHEAIGLATEYEALEGSIDRVKKPQNEETTVAPISLNSSNENKPSANVTLEQISKLIDTKLDGILPRNENRNKSPAKGRDSSFSRQTKDDKNNNTQTKASPRSSANVPYKTYCSYCKRTSHTIKDCYLRKRNDRVANDKRTESKSAYAITSKPDSKFQIIPTITITAPDDHKSNECSNKQHEDAAHNVNMCTGKNAQKDEDNRSEEKSISNLQVESHEEIELNTTFTSCLYLQADVCNQTCKFLIDTGSPYSIMSNQMYDKIQPQETLQRKVDHTRLRAADGSVIETSGKLLMPLQIDRKAYNQVFIIAKIQGIDGIIGMDFLYQFDGTINIKKQTLSTSKGKITLFQQNSNTCARIQIADTIVIPSNTEIFVKGKIEQPCIKNEAISIAEPTKFLANRGCFIARTLVNPKDEDIIMSILNLSDESVKVNQNSVIGVLQEVDQVHCPEQFTCKRKLSESSTNHLPEHLNPLVQNASEKLKPDEKQELIKLISQYQDIFMEPQGKLGQTNITEHEIRTGSHTPIKIPPRRIPLFKRQLVDQELDKMLEQGTIEPSESPWSAPICLVKKKDGTCRFCIDFRKLNAVTLRDAYPLPRIDDTLDSLSGSMWFSTLDLASGYWQIRMSESSKHKTAFVVPHRGLFHFNVMPFGLTNAPASFQRLMEKVLVNLTPHKCLCYLDDIIIMGKTFLEALENLKDVFQRLREANLKLKPKKCSLFQTQVTYLGHVVSENGIACDPLKIQAIEEWPIPSNKSEVRSALGLIGYYRKFIPQFAETAKPLTRLTRKNAKFVWTSECENAFLELKHALVCAPVLSYPKEQGIFVLDTDASLWGIGSVLSQEQGGVEKVIAFASKTLNSAQQNYCTTKRELLAVVTFMRHFKHYLLGRKFIIRTDHAPLVWLRNFKEPEGMIARWISIIETFDYELRYRPGRQHQNADALSRKPKRKCPNHSCHDCYPSDKVSVKSLGMDEDGESDVQYSVKATDPAQVTDCTYLPLDSSPSPAPGHSDKIPVPQCGAGETQGQDWSFLSLISPTIYPCEVADTNECNWLPSWSPEELQEMQRKDKSVKLILEYKVDNDTRPELPEEVQTDKTIKALWYQWDSLETRNGILYRKWIDSRGCTTYQLVAPDVIRKTIFDNLHSHLTAGHLGRDRTLESIKRRFYWPGIREDVMRWVKSCDLCARVKPGPGRGKAALQQFRVNAVMQCVAIDIFGPLPISENGNEYIIVLGEYFSKWVEAWAVPDHTAQTVADKLVCEFITKYGCPQQIHTDQGREFQSHLFKILCEKFGIKQTRTAPYRPNSDGLVERFNRTLKQMLRIFASDNPQNWDDYLPYVLMAYRATQNKSTGCTPNLVFLNREIACPLDLMVGPPPNTITETCPIQYIEWVESAMAITNDFVFKNLGTAAKRQKSYYDQGLKPRQYKKGDWVWRFYPPAANQKINRGWTGPYLVLKRVLEANYLIQIGPDKPIINVHVDDIKPYQGETTPASWLSESENLEAEFSQNQDNSVLNRNTSLANEQNDSLIADQTESNDHQYITLNTDSSTGTTNSQHEEQIPFAEENETLTSESEENTNTHGSVQNHIRQNQVPIIRSRRERPVKPKQIWSPS